MKKQTKILLILGIIVLLGISYGMYNYFHTQHKFECEVDTDCLLSETDTEDYQICVNTEYYKKAKKVHYDCIADTSLSCSCQQNRCTRSDKKVGCN